MGRDLSIYLATLSVSELVALDATDDRLSAIVDVSEKGKWSDAADRAQELASEGIFDIRPLSYVLYAAFREGGITAFDSIFAVLEAAVRTNFEAIGPVNNRLAFFTKRLVWLFGTIRENLEYYQKVGGAEWNALHGDIPSARVMEILGHAKPLEAALGEAIWDKTATALAGLLAFLKDFAGQLDKRTLSAKGAESAAATNVEEAAEGEDADGDAVDNDDDDAEVENRTDEPSDAPMNKKSSSKQTISLRVSPQFIEFIAKLRAFETLIAKGNHLKAAIVAEDVQTTIEHFDPRNYFPELLSRFSELMFEHTQEMEEHLQDRDSFAWKTSTQFYRVNLDKFVRG